MIGIDDIKKGAQQPYFLIRELNTLISSRFGIHSYNPNGIDIFEEDWDNLIILDACRFDVFSEVADLPGRLESRESKASATKQFIQSNFVNQEHSDTVYVTGNSWIFKFNAESSVHLAYDVIADPIDGDKPSLITECAKKAANQHSDKRLIVHYIRPHHPFIGKMANEYFSEIEQPPDLYNRIQAGDIDISDDTLQDFYRENLNIVLPHVEDLLESFSGKTVITADHGELLGERVGAIPIKSYGHFPGFYADELVRVPWHIYEDGARREIVEDEPIGEPDYSFSASKKTVDERLRDLGYRV